MADVRLFYIDDSGSAVSKLVVYGWVELLAQDWRPALLGWLDWRNALHDSTGVPTNYELHASDFANGRGNPTGTPWDRNKSARTAAMVAALTAVGTMPDTSTGAVYRRVGSRYAAAKAAVYADLVREIDQRLCSADEFGIVYMDGDGTAPFYRPAHRALDLKTRRIIDDPNFQGSYLNQWVQVADLIAYAAYQHVLRTPSKEAAWEWYPNLLGGNSTTGSTPKEL
ncbi:DUF3800 domain-containing protein [Actinosynnema sp.]|uniref:DUF3800 domain-containing protein n=1 Tax=Actinosynnema sp. TaxID=1872144 RepID=UPI003F863F72